MIQPLPLQPSLECYSVKMSAKRWAERRGRGWRASFPRARRLKGSTALPTTRAREVAARTVGATSRGSPDVTAVIAAHDESANIEACIASVDWAREVIVVENESSDDTVDRARSAGATVVSPKFTTIGTARNHGITRAGTPWILVLDADERCTP